MTERTQPTFWAAPDLIKAGYPVFPLAGKQPAVAGGFYAATMDLSEIAMWIEDGHGDRDVGVATGHVSGLVVIEADTEKRSAELERRFGQPAVISRKGAHWYFRHPRDGKVVSRKVATGVDCKADGGYVAVPPSTGKAWTNGIPDKASLPHLPKALREELRPGSSSIDSGSNGHVDVDELARLEASAVIARHVQDLGPGDRHEHLRHLSGALLSRGVAQESAEKMLTKAWQLVGGELAERAPREVPNTLRTTVAARAEGRATGVPSLEKLTPGLFEELGGILAREDPVLVDASPDPGTDGRSYGPLGERILLGKLITEGIEPPTHLEQDVLLEGAVHWLHGTADTGKTWIAAYLAKRRIEAAENVLVWDKENGPEIYGERLEALGCDPEAIDRHLFYHGEPNLRLAPEVLEAYEMRLDEIDPVLVIYDSARGFLTSAGLEENSNDDLDKWYEAVLKPVRNRKAAAVVLDHDPKDGNSARGAGRKKDLTDVMWAIKCPYPFDEGRVGMVRLVMEKGRRGGLPPSVTFSVGGGEGGFVFERSAGTIELEDEATGSTPSAQKALEALEPFAQEGATWKQWWDASMIESKATFNKARNELLEAGLVEQRGQRYFVTGRRGLSRSTLGLIDLDRPKAERSTRSTLPKGVDLVDLGEANKQVQANGPALQKDVAKPATVSGFFARPPAWLPKQLAVYRENPERHIKPLCAAVAAEVLGDAARGPEVRVQVEEELAKKAAS